MIDKSLLLPVMSFMLLCGHMMGDYLTQNDFLANRKHIRAIKTNDANTPGFAKQFMAWVTPVALLHATIYAVSVFVCTLGTLSWLFYLAVLLPHFVIDRFDLAPLYMDAVGQKGFKKHLAPWSVIVVDNSMHLLCILVAYVVFEVLL